MQKLTLNAMVKIKRVYEPVEKDDGYRMLVDRVWPRGIKKEALALDEWNKLLPPSTALGKWYGHQPEMFKAFEKKYIQELSEQQAEIKRVRAIAKQENVTLLYSAKDQKMNQAIILQKVLKPSFKFGLGI